ncbi:MAG: isochorismatase family protein [Nocardioidaceae bacterium]|nr:isochorismatase family protein [Nocardioidaceae bacterium]
MTTLENRPNRALLVVDMQVGVVREAYEIPRVTATIKALVAKARHAGVPVVWVQDHGEGRAVGSDAWQLVDELDPADGEPRVGKAFGDAFADTDLEDILAAERVGEVVLVGAASEQCIRCTMHSAVVRGYDVALVKGAHTTTDLTSYGMPEPEVVVSFIDMVAAFGMQWPGRAGRSVTPDELDL